MGTVSSPAQTINNGMSFGMTVPGGSQPVTVDLSTAANSTSLVYQVDNTGGVVTVTQQDLTNSATFSSVQQKLVSGTLVKAYSVPTINNTVNAYVLFYYTGTLPR